MPLTDSRPQHRPDRRRSSERHSSAGPSPTPSPTCSPAPAPCWTLSVRARRPVVLVNVAGRAPGRTETAAAHPLNLSDGFTDFLPELESTTRRSRRDEADLGCLRPHGSGNATQNARGVTQVVVTGVATSAGRGIHGAAGVRTGIQRDAGHRRHDRFGSPEAHAHSLAHVFPPSRGDRLDRRHPPSAHREKLTSMHSLSLLSYFFGGILPGQRRPAPGQRPDGTLLPELPSPNRRARGSPPRP